MLKIRGASPWRSVAYEPDKILEVLVRHHVRFVVIGGLGGARTRIAAPHP